MRLRSTLFVAMLALAAPRAQQRTHTVVRVAQPNGVNPAEVSVAINPVNPDNIVGVSYRSGRPGEPRITNSRYVSRDGGRTWTTIEATNPDQRMQGDDGVVFGPDGTAYHSYISFAGILAARPARAASGIFVSASEDGGRTWRNPTAVVDHLNTVTPFEDKPSMGVDHMAGSPHRNNLYVAWTRFDEYGSKDPECRTHIFFSRSLDGGRTFAMPFRISDAPGGCLDDDNTVEGVVPAVGVNGEVYAVWAGPPGLVLDKSSDGGLTFGKDRIIGDMPGGWDIEISGMTRSNGMPVTQVDRSGGPDRGSIYVNWIDARNGDPDVFVKHSRDGGETWSNPVRVNDDPKGNRKAQFLTWMAVDPADGSVNVVFCDRRDLLETMTALTLARSIDGGRTFENHRIDQPPFATHEELRFGDYIGIDGFGGFVVAMYPHFVSPKELAVSAALFRFKPGTQEAQP